MAADAFAALQIAGFAVASIPPSKSLTKHTVVGTKDGLTQVAASPGAVDGDLIYVDDDQKQWYVLSRPFGTTTLRAVPIPRPNGAAYATS